MNTRVPFDSVLPATPTPLQAYLEGPYNDIHGFLWNESTATTVLLDQAQKTMGVQGDVGEIGLWYGKYFFTLALLCREDEHAVGIDSFVHAADPVAHEAQFRQNLANSLPADLQERTQVLKKDSQTLCTEDLEAATPSSFRLFSVDGDHTCAGALHDMEIATPTLSEGGVLILDDFYNPTCPGVSEAYFKFAYEHPGTLKPFAYASNKLLLTQPEYAAKYYEYLNKHLHENPQIPFAEPMIQFHKTHEQLKVPVLLDEEQVLIILPNSWQVQAAMA